MEKGGGYSSSSSSPGSGDDDQYEEKKTEMNKVALMRSLVEAQDPAAEAEDDLMLRRFLRARDLDIEKGSNLFLKYLNWRRVAMPKGFISKSEIQNELAQKKFSIQGFDKQQHPIVMFFGARHYHSKRDMDEFKRFVVYVFEKLCCRMPKGQEKFTCIVDLQGWGYSNCDVRAYLAGLDIMQTYYPERLSKVLLIHVPYMFMKAWKMIYPFIDKNTRKKFIFVEDKNLKATLLEDIDESQLSEIYGGKLPLGEDSSN